MTPRESGHAAMSRLLTEIRADRRALAERDAEIDRFLAATTGPDDALAAALALVLTRSYTGLEAIVERITLALDGDVPRGLDWHRGLVSAACLDIPGVRPAVLTSSSSAVDELRRFRRFVRHAYAAPLDAARVRELARAWQSARPVLVADLDGFERFLEDLICHLDA